MSMVPYREIIGSGQFDPESGFHYIQLEEGDPTPYVAVEHFCTNPECSCESVLLEICRVSTEGKTESQGTVCFDMTTWLIESLRTTGSGLKKTKLERSFKDGLPESIKSFIRKHRSRVREIVQSQASSIEKSFVADLIKDGNLVGYTELFGEWAPGQDPLTFELEGRTIIVDEQYCGDPSCDCQVATLIFTEMTRPEASALKFAIRYSTVKNKYEVVDNCISGEELREMVRAFETAKPGVRKILSKHYQAVKREGKRILREERLKNEASKRSAAPAIVAGRNDPCPCGSGKKFKKCCGSA